MITRQVNNKFINEFVGAVLGSSTDSERIMSDVWASVTRAIVWDGEKIQRIPVYNSEFPATTTSFTLDATDEVFAAAQAFFESEEKARLNREHAASVDQQIYNASQWAVGKDVVVARGRKVPKGTEGRIFWMGNNGWGLSLGIETLKGDRVFTAAKNCDVINVDELLDIEELMTVPDYSVYARKLAADRMQPFYEQRAKSDARMKVAA